jgi:hypothetical protein
MSSFFYSYTAVAADMRRLGSVQSVLHATVNLGMIKVSNKCVASVYSALCGHGF